MLKTAKDKTSSNRTGVVDQEVPMHIQRWNQVIHMYGVNDTRNHQLIQHFGVRRARQPISQAASGYGGKCLLILNAGIEENVFTSYRVQYSTDAPIDTYFPQYFSWA